MSIIDYVYWQKNIPSSSTGVSKPLSAEEARKISNSNRDQLLSEIYNKIKFTAISQDNTCAFKIANPDNLKHLSYICNSLREQGYKVTQTKDNIIVVEW